MSPKSQAMNLTWRPISEKGLQNVTMRFKSYRDKALQSVSQRFTPF